MTTDYDIMTSLWGVRVGGHCRGGGPVDDRVGWVVREEEIGKDEGGEKWDGEDMVVMRGLMTSCPLQNPL